jgi:hypothetical protein
MSACYTRICEKETNRFVLFSLAGLGLRLLVGAIRVFSARKGGDRRVVVDRLASFNMLRRCAALDGSSVGGEREKGDGGETAEGGEDGELLVKGDHDEELK